MEAAYARLDAAFEFFSKLGVDYYCFHDRDLAPEGNDANESVEYLQQLTQAAKEKQKESGVKLLWGTANLFSHPRFMNGAATNPDFTIVTYAASQVKAALDATISLGGDNYVFWGGAQTCYASQPSATPTACRMSCGGISRPRPGPALASCRASKQNIGEWGVLNREIVPFRSCVRRRGLLA